MTQRFHALAKAILVLAVLAVVSIPFFATDSQASDSRTYGHGFGKPDSNGYVPEYYPWTVGSCYDGVLARTHYYTDRSAYYGPNVMWIEYDRCEMRRLGATYSGWERLKAHERAHSRGWAHGEGSPSYNASYYPTLSVR